MRIRFAPLAVLSALLILLGSSLVAEPTTMVEDLESLQRKLEDKPDDSALLEACGLAALEEEETDLGIWYLTLATEAAPQDEELLSRVAIELATYEYPQAEGDLLLSSYTETLFKVSKACASKKLYANAVDLLMRCRGTRFEEDANERLEKIFDKKQAVEALLASGIPIPTTSSNKLKPADIARIDAKHATWKTALEVDGKFYRIKTDMGYEMAHAMAEAMAQINTAYRQVFNYKKRGGSMRSCEIRVYRTRQEFDEYEDDVDQNVKGFYRPLDNNVTTYDPRTEAEYPGTLADLWSTLFHEASHQFTRAVWPNPIPTWLNEGTACYFEGARIERGGKVSFNGIPDGRLRSLNYLIGEGSPTVEQVITYFKPGSYEGNYYPFGWGLVYFMQNYEDEKSERVYIPVFEDFMESYKSGGKHDVKARFEEYFVKKAKQKDVKTYEDFVARWEAWIKELHRVHFGGEEIADDLLARAHKQLKDKKPAQAIESLKWALRKRPGDPVVLEELAAALMKQKQSDAALYFYRKLAERARSVPNPKDRVSESSKATAGELLERALAGIAKIDRTVAKNLGEADVKIVEGTVKLAGKCAEAGLNRSALRFIDATRAVMSGDGKLTTLAEDLGEDLDLRRWRRINPAKGLAGWNSGKDWSAAVGGIEVKSKGLALAVCREDTPDRFRFEAEIEINKHEDVFLYGLVFGSSPTSDEQLFAVLPAAEMVGVVQFIEGVPEFVEEFEVNLAWSAKAVTLALEVDETGVDFYIDGEHLGGMEGGEELAGRVGLFVQGAEAEFNNLRLKY